MKFKVTMKDPDALYEAISDALDNNLEVTGLSSDEIDDLRDKRHDQIRKDCNKWFEYGEYLTVEIDTDAKTCVVVPVEN